MRKGVTLIELLIFMAMIAGMSWAVTTTYTKSNKVQAVTNGAKEVRQALQDAKSYAKSGKKDCKTCGADPTKNYYCGTGDGPLIGWMIVFNNANKTYQMLGQCQHPVTGPIYFYTGSTHTLSSLVTLNASPTSVTFFPDGRISGAISITLTASGETKTVSVSSKGEIN